MFNSAVRLIVSLALFLGIGVRAGAQWSMAGSFNGWDAGDESWALAPEREGASRWMLERHIEAGEYFFRFATGGVFPEGALGKGEGGAALVEGGGNLLLRIPGDGVYRIMLNPEDQSWTLLTVKADRTVFDVRVLGQPIDGRTILLDLSRTLTVNRWDRGMFTCEAPAERLNRPQTLDRNGRRVRYTVSGVGPMTLVARLTDGGETIEQRFEMNVEPDAMLRYATKEDPNTVRTVALEPVGAGIRRALVAFAQETELSAIEVVAGAGEAVRAQGGRVPAGVYAVELRDGAVVTHRNPELPLMLLAGRWRAFAVMPPDPALTMHLSGDFNRWARPGAAGSVELAARGDGSFFTIIDLPAGEQRYRYIADGSLELVSSVGGEPVRGPGGSMASTLTIGPSPKEFPAAKPGHIEIGAVRHDPSSALDFSPLSGPAGLADISISTLPGDVERVTLTIEVSDGAGRRKAHVPLVKRSAAGAFDRWTARVLTGEPMALYSFALSDGAQTFETPGFSASIEPRDDATTWALGAAWYDLDVGCFRNGEARNDPSDGHGGDLQGVFEKIEYFREMGISVLSLRGLFETGDPRHMRNAAAGSGPVGSGAASREPLEPSAWTFTDADRYFVGTFLPRAREAGLRVVVDVDFSAATREHFAFSDLRERGAESVFAPWFFAKFDDAGNLVSWRGVEDDAERALFRFQPGGEESSATWSFFLSATRRWMDPDGNGDPSDGIDGWRLRSPELVDARFWRVFSGTVRAINPRAIVIAGGEGDQSSSVAAGQFDAAEGGAFERAASEWLENRSGRSARALAVDLGALLDDSTLPSMMRPNAVGFGAKRAMAVPVFFMGAPMVFAGTEVGVAPAKSGTACEPFPWEDAAEDRAHGAAKKGDWSRRKEVQALLALRADPSIGPALRYGSVRFIDAGDPGVLVFERAINDARVAVVISRLEKPWAAGALRRELPGGPATIDAGGIAWWRVVDRP